MKLNIAGNKLALLARKGSEGPVDGEIRWLPGEERQCTPEMIKYGVGKRRTISSTETPAEFLEQEDPDLPILCLKHPLSGTECCQNDTC